MDVRSIDTLSQQLAGFGFDLERIDGQSELAIDRFEQWTNPRGAVLACSCTGYWPGTDVALDRAA